MNSSSTMHVSKRLYLTLLATVFFIASTLPILLFAPRGYAAEGMNVEKRISLTENEKAWLSKHKTIRLAFDGYFPPYSFINDSGQFEGLAVDFIKVLTERVGINIETYPNATWKELYLAAQERDVDAVATMVMRPEREQWFLFTQPYIFKSLVIMTRADYSGVLKREDLAEKTVALVKGYQYVKLILDEFPSVRPYYVDNSLDALNAVSTGKADATITHLGGGHYLQSKYLLTNLKFTAVYDRESSVESIAVRRDWPELASLLDKALDSLSEYEKLQLQKKWLPSDALPPDEIKVKLTEKEQAWISNHPKIRLGIDPEFAPFEYIDDNGTYSGIASDYIKLLNKRLGLNMQIAPNLSWKEVVEKARTRELDVLPSVGMTEERKGFLKYSNSYINFHRVIISRANTPFITGLDDIQEMKVAVQANTSHEGYLKDHTTIQPLLYTSLQETLLAVSNGDADALVGNIASATYWIRKTNLTNLKIAAPVSQEMQSLYFTVRNDWPELVSIINKGLASISPEEKTKIRQKWVAIDYNPGISPGIVRKYILQIVSVSLFILVLFLIWNYSLKSEIVKRRKAEEALSEAKHQLEDRVIERTSELNQANEELRTMNELISACTSTLHLKDILDLALDASLEVTGLEGGTICLINPNDTFLLAAHRETSDATISDLTTNEIKVGDCLCGNVAQDATPLILWNKEEVNSYASREAQRGEKILFHAAFPIALKEKPLGVLCVFTRTDKKPPSKTLMLLETMMSQLSLAIENARLYEETLKNAETLEVKVTERTRALEEANMRLLDLDRLKSMFIASMSHELRTPLNSIIGFTGITLQGMSGELNEEQRDNLSRVYKASNHLLGLISDVIDISKIEAGRVDIFPKEFSYAELVDEAVASVQPQLKEKGLSIVVDPISEISMHTDRKRLLQCFLNILSNAVKYTEKGSITIISKTISGEVEFTVSDTGIGIEDKDMPRLFEAFERMQSHLKIKAGGTGLGLYLTKKIVTELLGGSITAQSLLGHGSTFTIKVPQRLKQIPEVT